MPYILLIQPLFFDASKETPFASQFSSFNRYNMKACVAPRVPQISQKTLHNRFGGPDIISAEEMRLTFIAGIDEDMKMSLILSTPDTLLEWEREPKVSLWANCFGLTLSTSTLVGFVR